MAGPSWSQLRNEAILVRVDGEYNDDGEWMSGRRVLISSDSGVVVDSSGLVQKARNYAFANIFWGVDIGDWWSQSQQPSRIPAMMLWVSERLKPTVCQRWVSKTGEGQIEYPDLFGLQDDQEIGCLAGRAMLDGNWAF